jgi:hypothetical protein
MVWDKGPGSRIGEWLKITYLDTRVLGHNGHNRYDG